MAVPTLLYGSECWKPRQEILRALNTGEIKFFWTVWGCLRLDRGCNDNIQITLGAEELVTTDHYKMDWMDHVLYMSLDRIQRKNVLVCPTWEKEYGSTTTEIIITEIEMPKPGETDDDNEIRQLKSTKLRIVRLTNSLILQF